MPSHKHAALIMEYAKLAQEHERPWEFFEWRTQDEYKWRVCNQEVSFWGCIGFEYRHKSQHTITIDDPEHPDYDPTPYCHICGAKEQKQCVCGPMAEND